MCVGRKEMFYLTTHSTHVYVGVFWIYAQTRAIKYMDYYGYVNTFAFILFIAINYFDMFTVSLFYNLFYSILLLLFFKL